MPCDEAPIICHLDRIADALQGFDLAGFLGTLLATAVGAGLAFAGAFAVYRSQRADDAKIRLNSALARVLQKVAEDIGAIDAYNGELAEYEYQGFNGDWDGLSDSLWRKHQPNLSTTGGLVRAAQLEATGQHQREAVALISSVVDAANDSPSALERDLLDGLISLIANWRAGGISDAKVREVAENMTRRLNAQHGWPPEPLPSPSNAG